MGKGVKIHSVEELTALLDATRGEIYRLESDRRQHEQEISRIDRRLSKLRGDSTNGSPNGEVHSPAPERRAPSRELRGRIFEAVSESPDGLTTQEIVPRVGRPITQTGIVRMTMGRMVQDKELKVKHEKGVEKYVSLNRPGHSA